MPIIIVRIYKKIKLYFTSMYTIARRKHWDYFEYKKLSKPFDVFIYKSYPPNKFYGTDKAVTNKLGRKLPKHAVIEHGVYFGNILNKEELGFYDSPIIYTMGKQRVDFLKENGIENVFSIGPYIAYASYFKSKEARKILKEKLGKVLLVFPSHSIEGVDSVFNETKFLEEIKKRSVNFETVLVCMYWKDILDKRFVSYEKEGFKIVTAGHRNDPYFLSRLKDLIDLSDITMSNNLGTHIGYSIALGKPHYLFKQENSYKGEKLEQENKDQNLDVLELRRNLFKNVFGRFDLKITKEQKDLVNHYWGDF